jgi:hypothetical protein
MAVLGNSVYFAKIWFSLRIGGTMKVLGRAHVAERDEYYPWAHRRCNDRV